MYRLIFLTLLAFAGIAGSSAQTTVAELFASAPDAVFPLLNRNTRLDMIDYFNSGSATSSRNSLDGQSRVTGIEPDRMTFLLSEATECELALLPAANDTVLLMITTVRTPVADSKVTFYNLDWKDMATDKFFTPPLLADWLTADGSRDRDMVEGLVPFMLVSYGFDPKSSTLTLTNNMRDFLSEDVYSIVSESLKPTLKYIWDGKKLKIQ